MRSRIYAFLHLHMAFFYGLSAGALFIAAITTFINSGIIFCLLFSMAAVCSLFLQEVYPSWQRVMRGIQGAAVGANVAGAIVMFSQANSVTAMLFLFTALIFIYLGLFHTKWSCV